MNKVLPIFLSVLVISLILVPSVAYAITTSDLSTVSPAQMATSIFPPTWQLLSETTNAATVAAGTFSLGLNPFNIEEGLIFSTGNIASAVGPNTNDNISTANSFSGDPDLFTLCGPVTGGGSAASFDSSSMEFVFNVPSLLAGQSQAYKLDFVYASDDYNEFAFSAFSDCMGIFVNDAGNPIDSNVAFLADSNPISANTVNGGNPFGNANAKFPSLFNNNDLQDGGPFFDTEYDGFTNPIESVFILTGPGPHKIKFAIADSLDQIGDSSVLISPIMESSVSVDDSDGDGVFDLFDNCPADFNPGQEDFDIDHLGDVCDLDDDNDGLSDDDELNIYGTNPLNTDSDFDEVSDGDEVNIYGSDPTKADTDGDGLGDGEEVNFYGTDPTKADTDGGGTNDFIEIQIGTNPFDPSDDISGPSLVCGPNTFESNGKCLPVDALAFCGDKTTKVDGFCVPDIFAICGAGTTADENVFMCFAQTMGSIVGGALVDINTISLLVGAIGINPIITSLVGITIAGVAGQTAWFVHRKRKSKKL